MAIGRDQVFKLQDASGTLTDITTYLTDLKMPRDIELYDTTTLGSTSKTFEPGLQDNKINFSFNWILALDTLLSGILGFATARTWEYYPNGTASGKVKYSGSGFLTGYDPGAGVNDLVKGSGTVQVSGAVTRAII
jgi:hypothetical protein